MLTRWILWCLGLLFIGSIFTEGYGQEVQFKYENFDGAKVELQLELNVELIKNCVFLDPLWFQNPKYAATEVGSYLALINGLFEGQKPQLKFLYDIFEQALPTSSDDYFIRTLICFVQSLPYQLPPATYNGQKVPGILPPLIALKEGVGDCDTKSLLFATIASHRIPILYLLGEKHVFIGIPMEPSSQQQYVRIGGQTYVLCEMTSVWPLGELPASSMQEINAGNYQYIILGNSK